jgi:hypothetical protein
MHPESAIAQQSVVAHEKFFSRHGGRFFFAGMRLDGVGAALDFSGKVKLRRRLEDLKQEHTTGIVLTEAQLHPAIDVVTAAGMAALVEVTIASDELLDAARFGPLLSRLAHTANIYRSYTGLCGYLIDLRTDAATPAKSVGRRMRDLVLMMKRHSANVMVASKYRPDAAITPLPEEDFLYAEVPPMAPAELRGTIAGIHELAYQRPVIVELAQVFPDQDQCVALAFRGGAAGVVAQPVPAAGAREWLGLRILRSAETMPFAALEDSHSSLAEPQPMVSVVVWGPQSEGASDDVLDSLSRVVYPNFEVIAVDENLARRAAVLQAKSPRLRDVRSPNPGLAASRNAGWNAAQGEIVAFIHPDCVADPHWLTFLVRTMEDGGLDGCMSATYALPQMSSLAAYIAADSRSAGACAPERLPHGCNFAFRKDALTRVGGFDSRFGPDGSEVDLWWRMKDAGLRLGRSPAALVWRSGTVGVKGYLGQQSEHGRDETVLRATHPQQFAAHDGGLPAWLHSLARVPESFEWTGLWSMVLIVSLIARVNSSPALAMLAAGPIWALWEKRHLSLPRNHRSVAAWVLVAMLGYVGAMCAGFERYRTRIHLVRIDSRAERTRKPRR